MLQTAYSEFYTKSLKGPEPPEPTIYVAFDHAMQISTPQSSHLSVFGMSHSPFMQFVSPRQVKGLDVGVHNAHAVCDTSCNVPPGGDGLESTLQPLHSCCVTSI